MPKIKKSLKTIKEDSKWKNIKTINTKTKKITKNKVLEKLAGKWKLPWYEVVKSKDKEDYLSKDDLDLKDYYEKIFDKKYIGKNVSFTGTLSTFNINYSQA